MKMTALSARQAQVLDAACDMRFTLNRQLPQLTHGELNLIVAVAAAFASQCAPNGGSVQAALNVIARDPGATDASRP